MNGEQSHVDCCEALQTKQKLVKVMKQVNMAENSDENGRYNGKDGRGNAVYGSVCAHY